MKEKTIGELAKEHPDKSYRDLERYRDEDRKQEAGMCIIGAARKDREEIDPKEKIKELEEALANALAVNESHQKLNGKLQERLTEVEEENKKLHDHLNKRINNVRKSGM
jgi:hypothetical protein